MIVQDKQENMQYFGAIQFDKKQAIKSLAMYPNVQMYIKASLTDRLYYPREWMPVEEIPSTYHPSETPERDFYFVKGHHVINNNDWLVTNKDGETTVYSDEVFKQEFITEVGDLS